jgi:SAM-dependent methyltransferase
MPDKATYSDYDNFAWFYNHYWSDRLIGEIFWIVEKYLLNNLPPNGHILDLCCGNAHLSARMMQKGFKVTGIDGSAEMLKYASINCPKGDFLHCDAGSINFDNAYDGVVSTCDSLSHVMSLDSLSDIFSKVYRSLRQDGIFLFDLNNIEGFRKQWKGAGGKSEPDNAFIVKLSYDDTAQQGFFEITMFRLIDNIWIRSDVKLSQQSYPHQSIIDTLKSSGFRKVDYFDCDTDLGTKMTGRDLFIAHK